jgi:hypothetical protein
MMARTILGVLALIISLNACATAPISHISVTVTNEDEMPVEGATVQGYFTNLKHGYVPGPERISITDDEGKANISGPAYFSVNVEIEKEGYYKSEKKIPVNLKQDQDVSILLRPKRNPVALYARQVTLVIPERGSEYGFDFLKGDLVLAGHNGSQADIKIKFDRNIIDENNFTQTVTIDFSNPADGIVEMKVNDKWKQSYFQTPYDAPLEGYGSKIKLRYTRDTLSINKENIDVPFFIRIRTKKNEDGYIETAYYCKIPSGVSLFGVLAEEPSLKMTYYCNSTSNDRNLEFNTKKNLFKNLKQTEKVWVP